MTQPARIYLDNAATSWPKPEAVYRAVDEYQRQLGAPAGRGAYSTGQDVQRRVAEARRAVASLLCAPDAKRIVFGFNGTDALNIALHGLLQDGGHVVTTVVEHNSVLRPLRWLAEHRGVRTTHVACDAFGKVSAADIEQALEPETRLIALSHASNVTGTLQPVGEVGRVAHDRGIVLLVDAAQSLGHVPIDVEALHIDVLASSGHKGLLGPLGTGMLYVAPGVEQRIESFRQGGTGTSSEQDRQPDQLPHRFESGNLNVPGIVGLGAGAAFVQERGVESLRRHEQQLTARLLDELRQIEGVTLYGPDDVEQRVGVVSFGIAGFEPQEVASMLDAACGIQVRAGLHCAPLIHKALGTQDFGGTVRISVGPFNTPDHVHAAARAVAQLAASAGQLQGADPRA